MVKTRRSSEIFSTMDPAKLTIDLQSPDLYGVPNAFPVSPSHSSSGSDGEESEGSAHIQKKQKQEMEQPFLATLISDPLYIHNQILQENADKERMMDLQKNDQRHAEKQFCGDGPMDDIETTISAPMIAPATRNECSTISKAAASSSAKTTRTASRRPAASSKNNANVIITPNNNKTSGVGMKLLSVLHTCPRSKFPQEIRTTPVASVKPNTVLQGLLKRHSYHSLRIRAKTSAYGLSQVSEFRQASFGRDVLNALEDPAALERVLQQGVSPNASNKFHDDIVFLVCKRNAEAVFSKLLEYGVNLQIVDSLGRTPLHYCAWAQTLNTKIVKSILSRDPQQLFMEDYRGQTPLDHVNDEVAEAWNEFLLNSFDQFYGQSLPEVTSLAGRTSLVNDHNDLSAEQLQAVRDLVSS